ncbi:discoidin domain-containing protein [Marinifilum sp. D737]|uniref:discoidin domain-containing protein n=1 Tax=Marinifilum sp. D737 TaxID=2969628 RepID=UPI002276285B|nr:discoidin domain-containing protein [Marinifilum sp. D737]MCY1634338.1 discoidin domain-containing protein [Marinifilum sp. D737]
MKTTKHERSNYRKFLKVNLDRISFLLFVVVAIAFTGCDKDETASLPETKTGEVSDITGEDAVVSGIVTSNGGSKILAMGICWVAGDTEPTVEDNFTAAGEFTKDGILEADWDYSITLKGLSIKTDYKARAYASNEAGTAYGETISFTSKAGKIYHPLTVDMIETYTQEGSEGPKESLVDGSLDTYWHSAWSSGVEPLPHHIQITFTEAKNIGGFEFATRDKYARGNNPAQFDVQTSTNGTDFTTVWSSERLDDVKLNPEINKVSLDKNYSSKYFRIRILDTKTPGQNSTCMAVLKVFEDGMLPY